MKGGNRNFAASAVNGSRNLTLQSRASIAIIDKRPAPAPNLITTAGPPMVVEARIKMQDGTTMTRLVAISANTIARKIRAQVQSAINLDPKTDPLRQNRFTRACFKFKKSGGFLKIPSAAALKKAKSIF
jgi:hypothetical protein